MKSLVKESSSYDGNCYQGLRHGYGRELYGYICYEGDFYFGNKNGFGMIKDFENNLSYIGEMFNGQKHGFGIEYNYLSSWPYSTFTNYTASNYINKKKLFEKLKKNLNRLTTSEYDECIEKCDNLEGRNMYVGYFVNGLKTGHGYYKSETHNLLIYGEFVDDNFKHGNLYDYKTDIEYRGDFTNYKDIHGEGEIAYPNGDTYEGTFINGLPQTNFKNIKIISENTNNIDEYYFDGTGLYNKNSNNAHYHGHFKNGEFSQGRAIYDNLTHSITIWGTFKNFTPYNFCKVFYTHFEHSPYLFEGCTDNEYFGKGAILHNKNKTKLFTFSGEPKILLKDFSKLLDLAYNKSKKNITKESQIEIKKDITEESQMKIKQEKKEERERLLNRPKCNICNHVTCDGTLEKIKTYCEEMRFGKNKTKEVLQKWKRKHNLN